MNLKNYLILLLFLFISSTLSAQLRRPSLRILSEIKKRTLIVNTDDFEAFEQELAEIMDSVWVFNEKIEYKTTKEIERLRDRRKKDYAVLGMNEDMISMKVNDRQSKTNPTKPSSYRTTRSMFLTLDVIERFGKIKHAYMMPLPIFDRGHRDGSTIIGIRILQNHIVGVLKNNRRQDIGSFADVEIKSKCELLPTMEFLLSNTMTYTGVREAVRKQKNYNIKIVTIQELEKAIFEGKDVLVSVAIPSAYTNPRTLIDEVKTHYFRAFVHARTGEFFVKFNSASGSLSVNVLNNSLGIVPREINRIGKKCK